MKVITTFAYALLVIFTFSGCASSIKNSHGINTFSPKPEEIYKATVAYCENFFTYNQVTDHVGTDRTKSPDIRKAEKETAWNKWLYDIENTKISISGKQYSITIPSAFGNYDENNQRMELLRNVYFESVDQTSPGKVYSAIPNRIIYNSYSNRMVPNPFPFIPKDSPSSIQNLRSTWLRNYYKLDSIDLNAYTISDELNIWESGYNRTRSAGEKIITGISLKNNIAINTSLWTLNPQSPIFKGVTGDYLDLNKFDFLSVFGVYPDTGSVTVEITYIFEIVGCTDRTPEAALNEVVVVGINKPRSSSTEIARIILKP